MHKTLAITINVPEHETATLKLTPVRATENMGPSQPLPNRATVVAPGSQRHIVPMMMGYYYVALTGDAGRCRFVASVPPDSASAANFVTMRRYEPNGPALPDFDPGNNVLVQPGETRLVYVANGQHLHCHEIPMGPD